MKATKLNQKSTAERHWKKSPLKKKNGWKLNNTVQNNPQIKQEVMRGIIKYLELNENENTTY